MALNGTLDDYSPAGALRVLSSTGRTGAVRFTGTGGCTAYLCEGQLYFARGVDTDDALASALVRPGRLTAEQWTSAVEEAGDTPRVGELLIASGAIEPDLLASVVLSVVYDPLITLFREGDGQFDFEPDTMHWIGPYRGFNVEAIVNEVRRRVRGVDEMADVVPSLSAWVSARRTLPDGAAQVTLLREDWELVTNLSGPRTVRELAGAMGRGQYSTAGVVHRLARAGLLEVVPEPFATEVDDPRHEPSAAARQAAGEASEVDGPGSDADEARPTAHEATTDDDAAADDATTDDDRDGAAADEPEAESDGADADVHVDVTATAHDHPDDEDDTDWTAGWAAGNPFDHAPTDEPDGDDVHFGPALNGFSAGPETAPDEHELLPRRTAVREADPAERWVLEAAADTTDVAPDDSGHALAGIVGFHDPVAPSQREDPALAEATRAGELDPNAAWLENLYAQFIDEGTEPSGKSKKKEALDVAFQAQEQQDGEKAGTLRRLVDALRRL